MNAKELIKVGDLPLRIFHWLLVSAFFTAYLTEDDLLTVHVWAGYVVGGLLLFRLVWGFIGNEYARFANFLCSPAISIAYLNDLINGKAKHYTGYNPAQATIIVLLLLSLLMTVATGLALYGADKGAGPLAFLGSDEHLWEIAHEFFARFALMVVSVHIISVAVESIMRHKKSSDSDVSS